MPRISRRKLAAYIADELATGRHGKDLVKRVAAYLLGSGQKNSLDLLLHDVGNALQRRHGHLYATVTTAHRLQSSLRHNLERFLARMTHAKHIEINHQTDPSIQGGVVIQTPGGRHDSSISGKIKRLKRQ
ncbi:MAG: hypothetical protein EOT04_02195 [Candidatus Chaera renei]|uniref:Uncharacterized protein n=1 Tax=Candidatus Chaera renei TaxID=2506947 RepID=A0A4Q0AIJ3_9BACT|nr:MAG: hypothetical protein EOT04_02195 [Candidatus Chaera renei]